MSEFKGTKGQWTVTASKEYSDSVYIVTENGAPTYGENEYNAQLIAHAPQMLEMLKEMNKSLIWCLEKLQENGNPYEVDFQLPSECDKLIQQATTI